MFMGINNGQRLPVYPCWMYKDNCEPVLASDTDQEKKLRKDGYDSVTANSLANRCLINWFWDLEDMSAKQLVIFVKEEYNVDLPIEAGQEVLFKAVCDLAHHAPQNENRLILMAHTIQMNYDATIEEIKRMMTPGINGVTNEIETFEVWA